MYDYVDENGALLFQVVRYKSKDFIQRRPNGKGGWEWKLGDTRRVLYRLPELVGADSSLQVIICEGEKDVDNLRAAGAVATCNPMGQGKWRPEYNASLAGRTVAIIPDNDQVGRDHAQAVARSLTGVARVVKVLDLVEACRALGLGELPEKGDASDFLKMGGTVDDLLKIFEEAPLWRAFKVVGGQGPPTVPPPNASADPLPEPRSLPEIIVTTDEFSVNNDGIAALTADPDIFCRGNFLVTVQRDASSTKLITRPRETPRIGAMQRASIRERLAKNARWLKRKKNEDGEGFILVPAHVPDWSTAAIEARGSWPGMRPLEGVTETPVLLPDGSILDRPGYDERSGLLYEPNCDFPPIPSKITRSDARKAAWKILDIITDFPFAVIHDEGDGSDAGDGGIGHRTAFLAGLLTPIARYAIPGPCPLFLADANTAGSGKTKLCDIVAILATGREAARTAYPESDEEMRKQILSIALEGDRIMLIDNVATGTAFGGPSLDGVLTGTTVKGRILGKSQMTREVPIYTVWFATGNNLGLKGDALRRVVHYRLESPEERPEERKDFTIKGDLLDHVRSNRGQLVVAALTILRGYVLAGRPEADLTPMDYPAWCRVVRNAIHWAIGIDPCSTRRELIADDPETNMIRGLFEGWEELPNGEWGLTAAQALKILSNKDHLDKFEKLREVLTSWSKDGGLPSAVVLGKQLKAFKGRVLGGKTLKSKSYKGTQSWRVVTAK